MIEWTFLLPGFFLGSYNLYTTYLIKFEFIVLGFHLQKKQVYLPVQRMLECDIKASTFLKVDMSCFQVPESYIPKCLHLSYTLIKEKCDQTCPVPHIPVPTLRMLLGFSAALDSGLKISVQSCHVFVVWLLE